MTINQCPLCFPQFLRLNIQNQFSSSFFIMQFVPQNLYIYIPSDITNFPIQAVPLSGFYIHIHLPIVRCQGYACECKLLFILNIKKNSITN